MVLVFIKIEFREDLLKDELIRLDELLSSLEDQEGYCAHSINIDFKDEEQLLLIVEWKNEVVAKNYMQTEEFKSLLETIKQFGKNYTCNLAGILSRGEVEIVREITGSRPIFETSHE